MLYVFYTLNSEFVVYHFHGVGRTLSIILQSVIMLSLLVFSVSIMLCLVVERSNRVPGKGYGGKHPVCFGQQDAITDLEKETPLSRQLVLYREPSALQVQPCELHRSCIHLSFFCIPCVPGLFYGLILFFSSFVIAQRTTCQTAFLRIAQQLISVALVLSHGKGFFLQCNRSFHC